MIAEDMAGFLLCLPSSFPLKVRDSKQRTPKRGSIPPRPAAPTKLLLHFTLARCCRSFTHMCCEITPFAADPVLGNDDEAHAGGHARPQSGG